MDVLKYIIPYPGLPKVLDLLVHQALASAPYCRSRWGIGNSLADIWQIGKQNLIYRMDASEIEQLQSVPTLFNDNIHGIPGAGDCDCFTIFTIAMLKANNFDYSKISIYLQGNNARTPSHVLTDYNGTKIDFTENVINSIRDYKYFDIIKI